MSVDRATVRRIARLARLAITDEEAARLEHELSGIQQYVFFMPVLSLRRRIAGCPTAPARAGPPPPR